MDLIELPAPIEFEWDKGNREKNLNRHGVSIQECESVFLNTKTYLFKDLRHSSMDERRLVLFGISSNSRLLTIVFTLRRDRIRIISARDMSRKEKKIYEEKTRHTKI